MAFVSPAQAQNLLCSIVGGVITGSNSTGCGSLSAITGNYSVANGYSSTIIGNYGSAYGAYSFVGGDYSVAVGAHSTAANASPYSGSSNSTALGAYATSGVGATAVGEGSTASGTNSVAIGLTSSATSANSTALGTNSSVTGSNAVAVGYGSVAGTANTVSFGTVGGERKLVNVATGTIASGSTDAVNGGQLYTTNTNVSTNTTNIATINSQLASGSIGLVQQNSSNQNLTVGAATNGTLVDFTGTSGSRKLTGLLSGTLSSISTDAVNGAQLYATNANVATNTANIATNTTSINTINTQLSNGVIGLVQQNVGTGNITVAAANNGTVVDFTGTAGVRKLTGLAAGTLSSGSTDAVNGAQLNTTNSNVTSNTSAITANTTAITANTTAISTANTNFATANQRVASAFGGGSTVDGNGIVTAPSYTVQSQTFNNVGGALGALDTQTTSNATGLSTLNSQLASGSIGLVQQNATSKNITVGATTNGTVVDLTGTAGSRKLTGLLSGTLSAASTDAVNGAQLYATNSNVTSNTTAITTANTNFATANQRVAAAFGGGSTVDGNGIVTAPSYTVQSQTFSNVGGALGALDTQTTANTTSISSLNTQLSSGSIGLVQQNATTRNINVAAGTNGTIVNFAGTAGARNLTGISAGTLGSASTDAVNGSQLYATNNNVTANTSAITANTTAISTANTNFATANQRVASAFGGGSTVDANGIVTAPSYTVQSQTFSNVGGALGALDTQTTANTTGLSSLNSQLSSGLIGLVQQNATSRNITIGSATDGTLVDITGTAGSRKLTGLSAATLSSASTDAVNGGQLYATNNNVAANTSAITANTTAISTANSNFATANQRVAAAFGGGSTVDSNGIVTAPSYTVQSQTFNNVGGALGALNTQLTTDTNSIASMNSQLSSGSIGLVQQNSSTRTLTVGAATDGTLVDFTGTSGSRKLTGLSAATLSSASTDAVNGAQLYATNNNVTANTSAIAANTSAISTANSNFATANQRVAAAFGGGSTVDSNGIVTAPSYTVQSQTFNNVGGALGALDTQTTANTAGISNINSELSSGSIGLVQQNATTRTITVGSATNGTLVDLTGTAGSRKLTGLLSGTLNTTSTDAVNGSQLYATNSNVAANTSAISTANTNFATANQRVASAFGGGSTVDGNGVVTAPSYTVQSQTFNNVGGALGALDTQTTANTAGISNINSELSSGSIGLVQQNATTRTITVGSATNGTLVDLTGTAGSRKLTGLLSGTLNTTSTDAVNGSQLYATNSNVAANTSAIAANTTAISTANTNFATANQRVASAFGGGSTVDGNGIVTAPSYTVQSQTFNNVGGAIGALDTQTTANTTGISSINSLLSSGSIGLVQQNATTRTITVGAATNGTVVDLTGTAGSRKLTGLQSGTLSSASTDAVDGAQLYATNSNVAANSAALATANTYFLTANQRLAAALGGGSTVDSNGIVTAPIYTIQGQNYTSAGSAFGAVNSQLTADMTNISNINAQLSSGSIGLVQQNSGTGNITIGSATNGSLIDVTGTSGTRVLTGLSQGSVSSSSADAVNGSQLFATNSLISANTAAISQNSAAIAQAANNFVASNQTVASALGGGSTVNSSGGVTAPSYLVLGNTYSNIGSALTALSSRVTTDGVNISALQASSGGSGGSGTSMIVQDPITRTIGIASTTDGTAVNIASSSGNRTLTGLAAGNVANGSTDAVNGSQLTATNSQLSATNSALANTNTALATTTNYATTSANGIASALGGNASVAANGALTNPQYTVQQQTYTSVGSAFNAVDNALSANSTTINNLAQSVTNLTTTTRSPYSTVNSTGNNAIASGDDALAVGENTKATGAQAVAIGVNSLASQTNALAVGNSAQATGVNAIAIGTGAVATGSVALGVNASAANGGAALGDNSTATGASSAALGPGATATAPGAVAVGNGSVATEQNVVSFGSSDSGLTRRLTNVSAGIAPTDAVNMSQLTAVNSQLQSQITQLGQTMKQTQGGVAMAMALAGNNLPDNKRFGIAMGVGSFQGELAVGISNYLRLSNNFVLSSGVAFQDRQVAGRAGIMAAW